MFWFDKIKSAYSHYKNLLWIFLKGSDRTLRSFFHIKRTKRSFPTNLKFIVLNFSFFEERYVLFFSLKNAAVTVPFFFTFLFVSLA